MLTRAGGRVKSGERAAGDRAPAHGDFAQSAVARFQAGRPRIR